MRYNPENTQAKLRGVPIEKRVFIYDATIVIEFLNETLMPYNYFYDQQGKLRENIGEEPALSLGDLYEYYKMFRQQKPYTSPIESRYKFSIIMKKLHLDRNGWRFNVRRVGRAQIIYLFPSLLRVKVDPEIRKNFPPLKRGLSEGQVEVEHADHIEPDTNDPSQFPAEGNDLPGY